MTVAVVAMKNSLITILLIIYIVPIYCYNLFLIGDSIDRQTVVEWCELQRKLYKQNFLSTNINNKDKVIEFVWGNRSIAYGDPGKGRMGSFICITPKNTVSFIHAFGSNAAGPYLNYLGSDPNDPNQNTQARIQFALQLYIDLFGKSKLSRVMLQFALWDLQYIHRQQDVMPIRNSQIWNESTSRFYNNVIDRVNDVRKVMIYNNIEEYDIGLRTAAWVIFGDEILHEYNNIIRRITYEYKLTLFDLDEDCNSMITSKQNIWNVKEKHEYLFRESDHIHPRQIITAYAANKMLGISYNSFMKFSNNSSYHMYNSVDYIQDIDNDFLISLVRNEFNQIYYITSNRALKFLINNNDYYLMMNYLGYGDVFNSTNHFISNIYESNPVPINLNDNFIINCTNGNLYVITLYMLRQISIDAFYALKYSEKNVTIISINHTEPWFTSIKPSPPIPSIYNKNILFIRVSNQKYVYYVKNGYKYRFGSSAVFFQYAESFDNVTVIDHEMDIDFIPFGDPPTL